MRMQKIAALVTAPALAAATLVALTAGGAHAAPCGPVTKLSMPKTAALAFSGGPSLGATGATINALATAGILGTFFETGDNYDLITDPAPAALVKREFSAGDQVAFTDWSHQDLTTLDRDRIQESFTRVSDAIKQIIGTVPTYEAPPYGNTNTVVTETVCALGLTQIIPTIDLSDADVTVTNVVPTLTGALNALEGGTSPIIMFSDPSPTTALLVPLVATLLKTKGYKLTTVATGLGDPNPYR